MLLNCDRGLQGSRGAWEIWLTQFKCVSAYGEIKNQLKLKGRPLPENDIWLAALARQYELILVTRDAHFQEVENLQTVAWRSPFTNDFDAHKVLKSTATQP